MSLEHGTRSVKPEYNISVDPENKVETLTLNHRIRVNLLRRSESSSYRSSICVQGEAADSEIIESKRSWTGAANTECDHAKGGARGKVPSLMHLTHPRWMDPQPSVRGLTNRA